MTCGSAGMVMACFLPLGDGRWFAVEREKDD